MVLRFDWNAEVLIRPFALRKTNSKVVSSIPQFGEDQITRARRTVNMFVHPDKEGLSLLRLQVDKVDTLGETVGNSDGKEEAENESVHQLKDNLNNFWRV